MRIHLVTALLLSLFAWGAGRPASSPPAPLEGPEWLDLDTAVERADEDGRPLLVVFR